MIDTFYTRSEEETEALGQKLAAKLSKGSAVLLRGELGAGKTVFARGIARGLGIEAPVKSPTFTIVREYTGRLPLYHFDLYRIADADELYETGFESYLENGVCVIEWPDVAEGIVGEVISVNLEYREDGRRITVEAPFSWRDAC